MVLLFPRRTSNTGGERDGRSGTLGYRNETGSGGAEVVVDFLFDYVAHTYADDQVTG